MKLPTANIIVVAPHETWNIMDQDVINAKKINRCVKMNHKSRYKIVYHLKAREYSRSRNKLVINQSLKIVKQIFIPY